VNLKKRNRKNKESKTKSSVSVNGSKREGSRKNRRIEKQLRDGKKDWLNSPQKESLPDAVNLKNKRLRNEEKKKELFVLKKTEKEDNRKQKKEKNVMRKNEEREKKRGLSWINYTKSNEK